jgi:hypothetical protein
MGLFEILFMISFKKYILLKENVLKTPDELRAMSPEEFADYADSLIVGVRNRTRIDEILEPVFHDINDNYRRTNYNGIQLWEARKLISKIPPNSLKFKKITINNSFFLSEDYEYVANVNGVPYGLNKWEDPDYDPYGDRDDEDESDDEEDSSPKTKGNLKYVWAYQKIGGKRDMVETVYNIGYGDEDVMKEMQEDLEIGDEV